MTAIAFILILIGLLIVFFSFVLKLGNNNYDRDFKEAIRNFEKQEELHKQENVDNSEDTGHNIIDNCYDDSFDDDEDLKQLLAQSKSFVRFIGIALLIVGAVIYFIYK